MKTTEKHIRNTDFEFGALIDLHCHLDGSLSVASARQLAELQGMPALTDEEIRERMTVGADCHTLSEFLSKFEYAKELLQTEEAITMAVNNLVHELHEQGLIYAEIRFAPLFHTAKGLTMNQVIDAAIRGLDDSVMPARLIVCCVRLDFDHYYDLNMKTAELAADYLGKGVVALDLACDDGTYVINPYRPFFDYAHQHGVPLSVHAGETKVSGTWSIRDVLDAGVSRIDHGVQAWDDEALLQELAERGIVLTLCPSSNISCGVFPRIEEYPYRAFMDAGVKVCLNTDDMSTIGITLRHEYEMIRSLFGMTREEAVRLLNNAIDGSFAEPELKADLRRQVAEYYGV